MKKREGKCWVDPRFRSKKDRPKPLMVPGAGPGGLPRITGPGIAGSLGAQSAAPCPPCPTRAPSRLASANGGARKRTLTPQERALEERAARWRAAMEAGMEEGRKEREAKEAKERAKALARAGRVGDLSSLRPTAGRTVASSSPGAAVLGEVNAQLAAQAATQGKKTTTRLAEAPTRPREPSGVCPPSTGAGPTTVRKRTLTPAERQLEERAARWKAAMEAGMEEARREQEAKEARAAGRRPPIRRPPGGAPPRACPQTCPRPITPQTTCPPPAVPQPCPGPSTSRGIPRRPLADVTPAPRGPLVERKRTIGRLMPVENPYDRRQKIREANEELFAQRNIYPKAPKVKFSSTVDTRYIPSRQELAAMMAEPEEEEAPPQPQTVVIQPGEIDPTETTVITIQPSLPPCPPVGQPEICPPEPSPIDVCPPPTAIPETFQGSSVCPPQRYRGVREIDTSFLQESVYRPTRPEALTKLDPCLNPMGTDYIEVESSPAPCPPTPRIPRASTPFQIYTSPTTLPAAAPVCTRIPQTTVCPTQVRTLIARPTTADPNVSVLEDDDDFDESELLCEEDFAGGFGTEDFHVVSGRQAPVERRPAASPPRTAGGLLELPTITRAADVYAQIERNKELCRERQRRREEEMMRQQGQVRVGEDPMRSYARVMTTYLQEVDPEGFAETYPEGFMPEAPTGELLDFGPEEFGPCARELLEVMKDPDYGPYASELLTSNLQINQPRPYCPGPFESELMENVELLPTTGYSAGRYGSELLSHVTWEPPRQPDTIENLLNVDLACPPPAPPSDPCDPCELADLLDW